MNTSFTDGLARAAGIVLVGILAAAAGLAAGNALQQVREASITAQAEFSQDALDDLAATRDDRVAAAAYPDYAIRHAPAVSDWALRHPEATYTLTWPGQGETELRSQVKPD